MKPQREDRAKQASRRLWSRAPGLLAGLCLQRLAWASLCQSRRAAWVACGLRPSRAPRSAPRPGQVFSLCSKAPHRYQARSSVCPEPWQRRCRGCASHGCSFLLHGAHVCCHHPLQGDNQSRSSDSLPCSPEQLQRERESPIMCPCFLSKPRQCSVINGVF